MDVMVLKKNMGEKCGIKLLLMFTVLYLLYGTTNATQATHCPEGTYLYYSKDNHICLTCPHETFMPLKQHTETRCYDCTKIKDPTVDIVVKPCNKVYDTDIQCVDGYYRLLARNPHSCNKCSSSCAQYYIQVHPCKNFTDIGCCFHENYDDTGLRKCSSRPSMCSRGQYLDTRVNDCRPCPNKTFMSEDYHYHTRCWDCQPILDTDLPLHAVITEPCTSTRPLQYGCQDGYYMKHGTSYRGDDITCSPCQTCDEGKYVGQQCNMYHDTVCCDKPNTAVAYIPQGGQCVEIIGKPHLHPYVGKLRVKPRNCQSVMCFVALEREKKKPYLTWEGPNVGQHQQFQYEEQNNETGMTVYHNTLTLCNFSAADVGQYRCRDNLWILRIGTQLDIVLACKDGSYNPPDCDKTCSQHCRPSERSDVSLCDNNSGTCLFGCVDGYTGDTCETVQDTMHSITEEGSDTSSGYVSTIVVLVILVLVLIAVVITCVMYNKHCQGSGPLWGQKLVRPIFTQPKRTVAGDIEQLQPFMEERRRYDKKYDEDQYEVDADTTETQLRQRRGKPKNSLDTVNEEIKTKIKKLQQMKVVHSQDGIDCLKFIYQTWMDLKNNFQQRLISGILDDLGYAGTCVEILREELQVRNLKDNDIWSVIEYTYTTCVNCSDKHRRFATRLKDSDAVQFMSNILRQQHYLDNLGREREAKVVRHSITVLLNIAEWFWETAAFKDSQTVEVLMPLIDSHYEDIKVSAIKAIFKIVQEEEMDKLSVTSGSSLCSGSREAVDNTTDRRYEGYTARTLTRYLALLAVADSNKEKIGNSKALELCRTLLTNTHSYSNEQSQTAECLYQLAHNDHTRLEIQKFSDLVSAMEQLKYSDYANVRQSVRRALWKIKGEEEELLDEIKEDIKTAARRLEQMTDYHSKDFIKSLRIILYIPYDYPSYSTYIGDLLCDLSYPETCMKILKEKFTVTNLNNDNIRPIIDPALSACWNFSFYSPKFAKRLAKLKAVQFMMNILKEKAYLDNLDRERERRVVEGAVNILQHIAIYVGKIPEFRDNNTVEVLMPLTISRVENIRVNAMIALAWIVEEKEKDKITDQRDIITTILVWLRKSLDNKEDRTCDGVTATLNTEYLTRLAVVDTNKRKIVEAKGLHLFCKMLRDPVTSEHHQTAQCLAIMTTDTSIRQEIQRFPDLVQALEDLQASDHADVRESVATALNRIQSQV